MLPESEHLSGSRYSWINWGQTPVWLPPDVANDLVQVSTVSTARGDLPDTSTILQGVPEGQRDDVLFRLACRLRRQLGDGARRAVEILILEAASNCDPPFPPAEALRKVESAWQQDHSDTFVDWMEAFVQSRVIGDESRRCVAGGAFILDEPGVIPAIWGQGERVLWPEGEGIMITGHQGVGKTTVAQQLVDSVADVINRHGINRDGALFRRFISLSVRDDPLPSKPGLGFAVRIWLRCSAAPLPSNAHPFV